MKEQTELYKLLKERDTVSNQEVRQEREPAVRDYIKMYEQEEESLAHRKI